MLHPKTNSQAMAKYLSVLSLSFTILLMQEAIHAQENVGVGTTTPGYRLDVQSNPSSTSLINVNSKVNYAGNLDIKAFEGHSLTADGFGIGGKFTGGYRGIESQASGGAYTGATYGVYGLSNGTAGTRVGVYGTAGGGTSNYGLWGSVTGGANHYGVYGQNTNLEGYAGFFNGRGLFTQELRADKNLIVDDTAWTRNIWNQSGILQLKSASDLELTIDRNDNGVLTAFFELFNGAGEKLFWVNESGHGRIMGNYYVDGDLGVGTTTPTTKLQIIGGSDASYSTHGFIQNGLSSGWNLVIDENEILARNNGLENELFLQRDGGDLLLCALELGSVGVGLTAGASIPSGYMFAVDGKIISEELRIQNSNNWPDYVFADHYELMPLEELKLSIETNRHLPNIPSAEVVKTDGILIGDMQKRMMEKIEELTLYILDLHEVNKKQQAEIDQLKVLLSGLEPK